MAGSATSVFEIRPDGALTNGCGFDPTYGGVDFSQSATPALTVTDAACSASTTISSATGGFVAQMVGNWIHVNGNLYLVTAITDSNHIVIDRAGGTFSGQTLNLGGAGAAAGTVTSALEPWEFAVTQPDNVVWIRGTNSAGAAASYSSRSVLGTSINGNEFNHIRVEGYGTVRGDGGVATFNLVSSSGFQDGNYQIWKNLHFIGNSATGSRLLPGFGSIGSHFENIICDNSPASGGSYGTEGGAAVCYRRCWFLAQAGATANFRDVAGTAEFEFCRFDAPAGVPNFSVEANHPHLRGCTINGGSNGIQINSNSSSFVATSSIIYGCTNGINVLSASLHDDQGLLVKNNIFDGNTNDIVHGTPISGGGAQSWVNQAFECNLFHSIGTRYTGMPASSGDITLGVSPFNNPAGGDFGLNQAPTGGQLVLASLCTPTYADGINKPVIIAGYYGTLPSPPATATLVGLWREKTGEFFTSAVPDTIVYLWLDEALDWLNRIAHYHYTTDTTTLTLAAGQQEYAVPQDMVLAQWVRWNGLQPRDLQPADIERWRNDGIDWPSEPLGVPNEWARYADKIVLRPAPSAAAVSECPSLTLRYVNTPPPVGTSGPDQLSSQAWRIVVNYAAAMWSLSWPDTVLAQQRAEGLLKEATEAAQLFSQEVQQRSLLK